VASRLTVRTTAACRLFPLGEALPSTTSAGSCLPLFGRFLVLWPHPTSHPRTCSAFGLVACNPDLAAEIVTLQHELRLRDGSASLKILPAKDVAGSHGKTYGFCGFDEIHGYRDWSLIEALSPDPTRADSLTWITSYASIYARAGAPLFDLMNIGRAGRDPRMLFSWYSGDYCSDSAFVELPPEQRANPSMGSWSDGGDYIAQQRVRLPFGRFRRLHLNLPGAPDGAAFDQGKVLAAVVSGRRSLPPQSDTKYAAYVDMSGGSSDDSVLAIGHREDRVCLVDLVAKQIGGTPSIHARLWSISPVYYRTTASPAFMATRMPARRFGWTSSGRGSRM
jgi:hypothetical protein